jgi:hypothetical protein
VKVVALVVVLAAGIWFWQHRRHAEMEHRLAAVATELAGRPVHVRCQGFFAELVDVYDRTGEVGIANGRLSDTTHLSRSTCSSLNAFQSASSHPRLDCVRSIDWVRIDAGTILESPCARRVQSTVNAITTLAHESMHLRGWLTEATAQCYAVQEVAWTVVRLGGTADEGAAVARLALAEQPAMPSDYRSSECRAGGALDLHPETPEFPTEAVPSLPPTGLVGPALLS